MAMQLLIVEDHSLVREGLRMLLDDAKRFERIWDCDCLEAGITRARELGDDLALVMLDLGLPDASGIDVLDRMRAARPDVPVIVVSGGDDASIIDEAFARGARGYVPKNSSGPALRAAVDTVLRGELYVPPHVLPSRKHSTPPIAHARIPSPSSQPAISSAQVSQLTPRQGDVLRLLARGLANKEIATELGMSTSTVRVHVTAVLKALGVENRTQAALSEAAKNLGPAS
jgi:DNA-binding NarL/FixJ family response regulator